MARNLTRLDTALLLTFTAALVGIVALLPFHAFLSTWGGTALGPLLVWKSWKEILIALLVPLVVWFCMRRPDVAQVIWSRWYNKLIAAYAALTIGFTIFSPAGTQAAVAGLLMNLRFLALFVLAQVVVAGGASWAEALKRHIAAWIVAGGVVLSGLAVIQVAVLPKDFLAGFGYNKDVTISPYLLVDDDPGTMRAFATMRGPNTLAAYLLLPLAVALLVWLQKRSWWAAGSAAAMVAALFLTHSRSGWLGALAMAAVLAWATLPREKLGRWLKFGTIPTLLLGALVLWLATTVPVLRLAVFHSGGNDLGEELLEGSTSEHWLATWRGLQEIAIQPLGAGVGTAGPASFYSAQPDIAENYYVQIGQEAGVIGLALFITISFGVAQALWQQKALWPQAFLASFAGIAVINFFLHGWADDPTAMTWWALAGLWVAKPEPSHKRV